VRALVHCPWRINGNTTPFRVRNSTIRYIAIVLENGAKPPFYLDFPLSARYDAVLRKTGSLTFAFLLLPFAFSE